MGNYADISELDDKAWQLRTAWKKTVDYAATLTKEFVDLQQRFDSGRYGPEWTFARWLGVKCGMSRRTTYRVIEQLHRVYSEDQREQIKRALEEERKAKALAEAGRRATRLAWDRWLAEEKDRRQATQAAWDQWKAEEKQRVKNEKDAARKAETDKQKKEKVREYNRRYYALKKAEKANQTKGINSKDTNAEENEKAVPNVARVTNGDLMRKLDAILDQLVAVINQFPGSDRATCKERIIQRLEIDDGSLEAGEGAGHARFDA